MGEKTRRDLDDIWLGVEALSTAPLSDEEQREITLDKRRIVESLVERVEIGKDLHLTVIFRLNFLKMIEQAGHFSEVRQVGTYTDRFDLTNLELIVVI